MIGKWAQTWTKIGTQHVKNLKPRPLKHIAAKPRRRRHLPHVCNPKKIGTASKATAGEYTCVAKLRKLMAFASQPAKHALSTAQLHLPCTFWIRMKHASNHAKDNIITCTTASATMVFQFGRSEKWSDLVPEKWSQKGHKTRARNHISFALLVATAPPEQSSQPLETGFPGWSGSRRSRSRVKGRNQKAVSTNHPPGPQGMFRRITLQVPRGKGFQE